MNRIRCHYCKGRGTLPLPLPLRRTLAQMPRDGASITAEMLLLRLCDEVGITAINNRLEDLRALRLVTRRRRGKFWHYSRRA